MFVSEYVTNLSNSLISLASQPQTRREYFHSLANHLGFESAESNRWIKHISTSPDPAEQHRVIQTSTNLTPC
jgi:hypothetical protein